jgi:hypothetical protein
MNTLLLLFLATGQAPAVDSGPTWLTDYGVALRQARLEGVPLLVVLDNPQQPRLRVEQVALTRGASDAALLEPYKLCHVDVRTPYGQAVARAFQATEFPRTVIIDNTASVQLFRKTGQFTASQWATTLTTYRDGRRPYIPPAISQPIICRT